MKNNIKFIVHSFDEVYRGGVLRVVSILANNLVKRGMDVSIYSLGTVQNPAFMLDEKVKIIALNMDIYETVNLDIKNKIYWIIKTLIKLIPIVKESQPSIWITSSSLLSIIFSILKNKKNRIIGCDHTSTFYLEKKPFTQLRNFLIKRLDIMISLTKEDLQYYEKKKITSCIIPNPIEELSSLPENNKNIIFIGRFSKEKQPLEALHIFYESKLWEQGYTLKMFGYGELKSSLYWYINEKKLNHFVSIIESENNIKNMLTDSRCLIVTSEIEGFSLSIIEALSFGIPCFAYDAPYGPRNLIINGVNGYLVKLNDRDEFISKIRKIDNYPISKNIQNTAKPYLIQNIINEWELLLSKLQSDWK